VGVMYPCVQIGAMCWPAIDSGRVLRWPQEPDREWRWDGRQWVGYRVNDNGGDMWLRE